MKTDSIDLLIDTVQLVAYFVDNNLQMNQMLN